MPARALSLSLVVVALFLIGLGGVVHTTGSSLACPDWPLCNGEWLPVMRGGVAYEHSHRLLALALALGVASLPFTISGRPRRLAAAAVGLVCVQALLGAATVIWGLPPPVSIAHLLTATCLLALLAWIALDVRDLPPLPAQPALGRATGAAVLALFVQLGLGAAVRHLGAGAACGDDPLGCDRVLVLGAPAVLQLAHRAMAGVVLALVVRIAALAQRDPLASSATRSAARLPLLLVAAQIALGMAAVAGSLPIALVTLHLVCAELALLSLVVLARRTSALGADHAARVDCPASTTAQAPDSIVGGC